MFWLATSFVQFKRLSKSSHSPGHEVCYARLSWTGPHRVSRDVPFNARAPWDVCGASRVRRLLTHSNSNCPAGAGVSVGVCQDGNPPSWLNCLSPNDLKEKLQVSVCSNSVGTVNISLEMFDEGQISFIWLSMVQGRWFWLEMPALTENESDINL